MQMKIVNREKSYCNVQMMCFASMRNIMFITLERLGWNMPKIGKI